MCTKREITRCIRTEPIHQVRVFPPSFMSTSPPIIHGYGHPSEKGNRKFFQDFRTENLSRYSPPLYKWGPYHMPYCPEPELHISHKKQRWEEMLAKPELHLTFVDPIKKREIDDFYMVCQFQRQYYNDNTGRAHPLDFFQRDVYSWSCPPTLTRTYLQCPMTFVGYKKPVTLPLTLRKTWHEPFEPCRRLAGKYEPGPDNKYAR